MFVCARVSVCSYGVGVLCMCVLEEGRGRGCCVRMWLGVRVILQRT